MLAVSITCWTFKLLILCFLAFSLSFIVSYIFFVHVIDPVCGVKGSTVTLPCSFNTLKSVNDNGREVLIEVVRVAWCQSPHMCWTGTPFVYDSESQNNDPRYRYLGDKKGDCTLQISDLQKEDDATFRFRVETNDPRSTFTGQPGVRVTMKISSSRDDGEFIKGEAVTLNCSAAICTIHQLEVTWFRDGSTLSESGPALHLGYLTAKDSGNYTCGLKRNNRTLSVCLISFLFVGNNYFNLNRVVK
uniref:Ig-like domain-containing protein n=1 Tax=Sander lucioperca TaxID=283035 RepID=A0A8D0CQF9_SANLU